MSGGRLQCNFKDIGRHREKQTLTYIGSEMFSRHAIISLELGKLGVGVVLAWICDCFCQGEVVS